MTFTSGACGSSVVASHGHKANAVREGINRQQASRSMCESPLCSLRLPQTGLQNAAAAFLFRQVPTGCFDHPQGYEALFADNADDDVLRVMRTSVDRR